MFYVLKNLRLKINSFEQLVYVRLIPYVTKSFIENNIASFDQGAPINYMFFVTYLTTRTTQSHYEVKNDVNRTSMIVSIGQRLQAH